MVEATVLKVTLLLNEKRTCTQLTPVLALKNRDKFIIETEITENKMHLFAFSLKTSKLQNSTAFDPFNFSLS